MAVLDVLFGWVLDLPLWLGILILSFGITLIMNVVYMWATDQKEMKRLKAKLKDMQAQMKEHRDDPKKAMKLQKKAMSLNGEYMKKSLKPTLYTFIPIILVFGWMAANLAFAPLAAGAAVPVVVDLERPAIVSLDAPGLDVQGELSKQSVEQQVSWMVSGEEGNYTLTFSTQEGESASRSLVVGERPDKDVVDHEPPFAQSTVEYPKATPLGDFSVFGYQPGWLMTYIVFSLVLSLAMRKLMGLH